MNNFPIIKLLKVDDLYLHGMGEYIDKLITKKSERKHYYWIKNQKPIKIKDLKSISKYSLLSKIIKKLKFISAYASPHIIKIPKKLNKDLAYLCGYHMGDGSISKNGLTIYYMDSKKYLNMISGIYQKLFGIKLSIKKDRIKNGFNGTTTSKALAYILHYCLEMPIGKKPRLHFPKWVNNKLKKDFISGYLDAEFGITRKKFQFSGSSIDKKFIIRVKNELKKLGLDLKLYGPYKMETDTNPRWFLKTSKIKDMYFINKNKIIKHPNSLKTLRLHIKKRSCSVVRSSTMLSRSINPGPNPGGSI